MPGIEVEYSPNWNCIIYEYIRMYSEKALTIVSVWHLLMYTFIQYTSLGFWFLCKIVSALQYTLFLHWLKGGVWVPNWRFIGLLLRRVVLYAMAGGRFRTERHRWSKQHWLDLKTKYRRCCIVKLEASDNENHHFNDNPLRFYDRLGVQWQNQCVSKHFNDWRWGQPSFYPPGTRGELCKVVQIVFSVPKVRIIQLNIYILI